MVSIQGAQGTRRVFLVCQVELAGTLAFRIRILTWMCSMKPIAAMLELCKTFFGSRAGLDIPGKEKMAQFFEDHDKVHMGLFGKVN